MAAPPIPSQSLKLQVDSKEDLPVVLFKNQKTNMGVVVLQEWWGMNEQIQETADDIARGGNFTTIVPDLYRGKIAKDNEHAGHLMKNLDWPGAVKDIEACVKYLHSTGCIKVGVTGFCMGGALSMAAAGLIPEVSAAVPFYGICSDDLCNPKSIETHMQLHFGEKDAVAGFSDPAAQKVLLEKLKEGKVPHEFYSYDAGHAFTNKTAAGYNAEACDKAFTRMYEFFKKHLH